MNYRKTELYLVTVRTLSSVYLRAIESESLHRAARAGVLDTLGIEVDWSTWTSRRSPAFNASRLLLLESTQGSIGVTAEALTN